MIYHFENSGREQLGNRVQVNGCSPEDDAMVVLSGVLVEKIIASIRSRQINYI